MGNRGWGRFPGTWRAGRNGESRYEAAEWRCRGRSSPITRHSSPITRPLARRAADRDGLCRGSAGGAGADRDRRPAVAADRGGAGRGGDRARGDGDDRDDAAGAFRSGAAAPCRRGDGRLRRRPGPDLRRALPHGGDAGRGPRPSPLADRVHRGRPAGRRRLRRFPCPGAAGAAAGRAPLRGIRRPRHGAGRNRPLGPARRARGGADHGAGARGGRPLRLPRYRGVHRAAGDDRRGSRRRRRERVVRGQAGRADPAHASARARGPYRGRRRGGADPGAPGAGRHARRLYAGRAGVRPQPGGDHPRRHR